MGYFTFKSPTSELGRGDFSAPTEIFLKPETAPQPFYALRVDKGLKIRIFFNLQREITSFNTYGQK
jgi:hypothetical protein